MHIHTVFFWLSNDVGAAGRATFENGLDLLTRDPHIVARHIGRPAATDRPVIDSTYSYAIVLRFETLADHDAYQVSDAHQVFLDSCSGIWSRLQVYDIEDIAIIG